MPRLVPVQSSLVLSLSYDADQQRLYAQFGEDTYYAYDDVPPEVAARVVFANSIGSAFTTLVKKGGFNYRVATAEEALA